MEDQQRLNSLLNEINVYRQQAELIQQQIEMIRTSMAEVDALFSTLDDIEGKESVEAFVPVGAGAFAGGRRRGAGGADRAAGALPPGAGHRLHHRPVQHQRAGPPAHRRGSGGRNTIPKGGATHAQPA